MTPFQEYISTAHYSRWIPELGRRESWGESVGRYIWWLESYICKKTGFNNPGLFADLEGMILNHEIMPSMRALYSAGKALDSNNAAAYNCAYLPIQSPEDIAELLFLCMSTCGVGFSVESRYVDKWGVVPSDFFYDRTIKVEDTREGWADAVISLFECLFAGETVGFIPEWDLSAIRPPGSRLETFGGYASGPGPLDTLLHNIVSIVTNRAGRKLRPIDLYDICCHAGNAAVAGGVRRSALLSLSDFNDEEMAEAKSGDWYSDNPHRSICNNSAVYEMSKVTSGSFMGEWLSLYNSRSGERGIFNRTYARSKSGIKTPGTNPCGEIILRPYQFCNLTSVIVRPEDTWGDLRDKVGYATILGTFQSLIDDFHYLRPVWKVNAEKDRLLGVSLTGIMDNPRLFRGDRLDESLGFLNEAARDTNLEYSKNLGINKARAITCVKPEGTVSQLTNTSSGIHPRYSEYYIRRVERNIYDPISKVLQASGIPFVLSKTRDQDFIFEFYLRSPSGSKYVSDTTAIQQLELIKTYQEDWADHNISATVYVREHEWMSVGAWVYDNMKSMAGVTFFPFDDNVYTYPPYSPLTKEEYEARSKPLIRWDLLSEFEKEDTTEGSKEYACVGGACDII